MPALSLRTKISRKARQLGADLVGFAPVSRWEELDEVPSGYRPQDIWSQARSVIVLGVPMLLPILESTPSINYTVMYDTTNTLLDQLGYRLALHLNGLGHASIFLPRDGYGSLGILKKRMAAAFSQMFAGKYAGLGTIGQSHNLLNPKHGPRARYVSVFTTAELAGDPLLERDLCHGCGLCSRLCPSAALQPVDRHLIARFDAIRCTEFHELLLEEKRWPCGVCAKVCPVGEDRELYRSTQAGRYLRERQAIADDPDDPLYRHLVHLRRHGSGGDRIS